MKKTCLIIDDKDQSDIFESKVTNVLKKEGYSVEPIIIHTVSPDLLNSNSDIDIKKLSLQIEKIVKNNHLDVVASDFDLSDSYINGLDVVDIIRGFNDNVPIILYSGALESAIEASIGISSDEKSYENEEKILTNCKKLVGNIKKLVSYQISSFNGRQDYSQAIIKILKKKDFDTKNILLRKLKEYPDAIFLDAYPNFSGKTFKEIAKEIECSTPQGLDFQTEIIEQVLSYMLDVSND